MKLLSIFVALLLGYLLIIIPFSDHMKERPVAVKLGYTPNAEILKMVASEYRFLLAELDVIKVLFYFGTVADEASNSRIDTPEYGQMYSHLVQAAKLDPLNQDTYYFSQAIFSWDVGRVKEVNKLLDYGMRFRKDDWHLPYYAGFNAAYFLKDYQSAARYFQKAAEISGSQLFTKLAARYFHEAGQGDLGILFLDAMIKGAKNQSIIDTYELRKQALEAAMFLKSAVTEYRQKYAKLPRTTTELVVKGFISKLPDDPYGGQFFITEDGKIQTTSKFAYIPVELEPDGLNGTESQ